MRPENKVNNTKNCDICSILTKIGPETPPLSYVLIQLTDLEIIEKVAARVKMTDKVATNDTIISQENVELE